jgi:hypothetical protein
MIRTLYLAFLALLVFVLPQNVFAIDKLVVKNNPNLAKKANAIIQSEETVFTVNSIGSGTTHVKSKILILNENGLEHAKLYVPYDKLSKVDMIEGTSYDINGKKVKTLRSKDIVDVSAISDFSLFEDNRVKIADLSYTSYPFTVEFEYQTTSFNMLFYPIWQPQNNISLSVAKATFTVAVPKGTKLRYHEENVKEKVKLSSSATHELYKWEITDLTPIEVEPYSPHVLEQVPTVRTAPSDFEVQGYKGNMESWQNFGIWFNKLNSGRDALPETTQQKLQALVANCKTKREKAELIYDYLQNKTRYVSIQLGIGGWQPFEADFVDSKGYGDCKALTNYTQAMLKAVGIESYHALIRAGEGAKDITTDFPSSQFNHVILSVPMESDTLWLECTSQTESAGYSGKFTGDRHALMVTPEGGKIVKTPHYSSTDNTQKRKITVKLDEKGNGVAWVNTLYSGLQQDTHGQVIHQLSPAEQSKWLYRQISLPSFEIAKFSINQKKGRIPIITEQIELNLRQVVTISGKRLFLTPNLMNKWHSIPGNLTDRKTDIVQSMSFFDSDTVVFHLPVGYAIESLPKNTEYITPFGSYKTNLQTDGQQVKYIRTLEMHRKRHQPEQYTKYLEFLNNIIKTDNQQVVFVKNVP